MEGCFGTDTEGNLSPETLRRWTSNVNNVLNTPNGLSRLRSFLGSCQLDEGIHLVNFWEMCYQLVADESEERGRRCTQESRDILSHKAKNILCYAEENINLDVGYLHRMNSAIESKDKRKVLEAISEAKDAVVVQLEVFHGEFCQYLVKQQRLSKS